jgi:hypothetical protein
LPFALFLMMEQVPTLSLLGDATVASVLDGLRPQLTPALAGIAGAVAILFGRVDALLRVTGCRDANVFNGGFRVRSEGLAEYLAELDVGTSFDVLTFCDIDIPQTRRYDEGDGRLSFNAHACADEQIGLGFVAGDSNLYENDGPMKEFMERVQLVDGGSLVLDELE